MNEAKGLGGTEGRRVQWRRQTFNKCAIEHFYTLYGALRRVRTRLRRTKGKKMKSENMTLNNT